ncbi:Wound-induced polypeptide 3 [Hibiscus trionum]|uniref:Wound-induced polypeptide 3 n=1 Tax=Hibiscus trionum TaxID=183268 RepID=A0A9W7LRN3_HIBTR|nr:Wound-induced polypeptide 3 [Hibiscus trionum]
MSCAAGSKAWFIAASVGAVEGLKDQGFCRWNIHAIRAFSNLRSYSQANNLSSSSSSSVGGAKAKQGEESLRKVMYLSCWGPY